jgi:outer membrane protein TolC
MRPNLVIFTCLVFFGKSSFAADDILKKLMDKGFEKSIEIETQNINYNKSKNNTWRSYAALLPTLSTSTSRTYTRTKEYDSSGNRATTKSRTDALTLSADWVIWDNFSTLNGLRSSRLSESIEKHNTEFKEQLFYNKIVDLYFTIQELIYKKNSTQELFKQAEKAKEEAQYLIGLGQKTKFEAYDAEIDMVNAERDLMEIKNDLEVSNRNLKYLIGTDEDLDIPPIDLLTYKPFYLEEFEKSFAKYKESWKENYEFRNQSILISKLEFEQSAISYFNDKLSLFPKLSISVANSYDYSYKVKQYASAYETSPKNDLSLGLSATWSLWDFWSTQKKVDNSRLDFKIAEINFKDEKIKVQTEIQNFIDQYEINLKSVEASVLVLDKAVKNYEYNSYMYKLGKISLITRQRAMTQLHSAKIELASRLKNKYLLASQLMIKFGEKIYARNI